MSAGEGHRSGIDVFAEAEALVDGFGPRPPGSDAERRAAAHLAERLRALGRPAELEPFSVWPGWPLAYALHAGLAILGSVLAVSEPLIGFVFVLTATFLTLLDATATVPTTRRLLGRRMSQNIVSWGERDDAPGAIVLVAHYDSGRGGLVQSDDWRRRLAALGHAIKRRLSPLSPFVWSLLVVLGCCLLRLLGLSGGTLTVVQFAGTVGLVLAVPLLLDIALSTPDPGENDNASGVALALRLAERAETRHLAVHVVLSGSQKAIAQGMQAFLRSSGADLSPETTFVLNLDQVGDGRVRYSRREGALLPLGSHARLAELCDEIAEDEEEAGVGAIVNRSPSDGYAARAAGLPSITITCRDERGYASRRLDEAALARAESFCLELIRRLDAELGPG
jgi:Peptidase family M28